MSNGIFGNNRMYDRPKFKLYLTDYEMSLIIKCMVIVYKYEGRRDPIYNIDEKDKDNLYYLHRALSCMANEFFFNIINNEFYTLNY